MIAAIPVILIISFGLKNESDLNQNLFGLIAVVSLMLYCYFEEIGWRGYLQYELQNIKQWQRVLIIGFLWWFWHLGFIENFDLFSNIKFLIILTVSAWGLGILIEHTKSVLVVSAFHMIVNILFLNPIFTNGLPLNQRLIVVAISFVLWTAILILWEKQKKGKSNLNNQKLKENV